MINTLQKALAEACEANRFAEKKLVVKTYHDGHQLLEAAARGGSVWLNVTPVTAAGLAEEVAGPVLADQGFRVIDDGEIINLTGSTLAEMRSRGELQYFADLEGLYGPEGILKGALMELRLAGVKAAGIDPAIFVDRQKGEEIKKLLAGYEQKLQDGKLADQASVYIKALELLQNDPCGDEVLYLIPGQLEFDCLAFKFLQELTAGKAVLLPAEAVCGLSRPAGFYFQAEIEPGPGSPLAWLYALEGAGAEVGVDSGAGGSGPDLEFFQAYSPTCEIKEVFRRLKKEVIPADRALICYTNGDVYLPLIHSAAQTFGIPLTYAGGLPAAFTHAGKLLAGLLDWIEDNYSAINIYRLICTGGFKTSWAYLLAELLRRAAVGWGRERYAVRMDVLEKDIKEDLQRLKDRGYNTHYQSVKLDHFPKLQQLLSNLLAQVPAENDDGTVQFDRLCRGLSEIITKYTSTVKEVDRLARESLLEMLEGLAKAWPDAVEKRAAVNRIKARLQCLRCGASAAAAGHLHVASIEGAECSDRPHSFAVGLAGEYFPGSGLQDAVLLDREREKISAALSLHATKPERNLYNLTRLLASRRGRVVMSFSCFDPVQGRPAFPAPILLQAYRLKSGNTGADYSSFFNSLDPPAAYYPVEAGQALAANEWWLSLVLGGCKSGSLASVTDCYPGLKAGLEAEDARRSDRLTEFDGRVGVDPAQVDPRQNSARTISASAFEKLAGCPYAYFLHYLLYIRPPEEQSFDRWSWLNVMERGILLHRIYTRYLREVCSGSGSPQEDKALLKRIAGAEIAEKKKSTPPPSELVFQSETNELLRELEFFLKCEAQLWKEGSIPVFMEVPFGLGPEEVQAAGTGLEDPLELTLPRGGKILLRGSIDRIDRLPEKSRYRVWDFKTGGTSVYKRKGYIRQGRQIQNAIYAIAAEEILQKYIDPNALVLKAGYLFPTEKGEGEQFLRDQARRNEALEALDLMLDLLAAGAFCVADNDKGYPPCNYCDYQAVCRHPQVLADQKLKKENSGNSILEPWKELQKYE